MKTRSVRAELLNADRRADMAKPIVALRNLEKAPKKQELLRFMKFRKCFLPSTLEYFTFVICLHTKAFEYKNVHFLPLFKLM